MVSGPYSQEINTHTFIHLDRQLMKFSPTLDQVRSQNIIANTYNNFREWNFSADYLRRYFINRNNKNEENLKQSSGQGYERFIADLIKCVYEKLYGVHQLRDSTTLHEIEECLKRDHPLLYKDFAEMHPFSLTVTLWEIIQKIIDGLHPSCYCLASHSYSHYLNLKLSPAALGVSYYYFRTLYTTSQVADKPRKSEAPKITYLSFTGFYSEIDIDVLYQNADNVQVIMIYDSSTGGPSFNETEPDRDARASEGQRRDFRISNNILLLPLDCSDGRVSSKAIKELFEQVVYRAIRSFRPELLVVNHSFNFHPEGNFPFALKASAWQKILHNLCLIVSYKILIFPHKLVAEDEYALPNNFDSSESLHLCEFRSKALPVYSRPWNSGYFEDCFVKSLEALSGMKKFAGSPRKKQKSGFSWPGAAYDRQLVRVLDFYSSHPVYNYLGSRELGTVVGFNREYYREYLKAIFQDSSAKHYLNSILHVVNMSPHHFALDTLRQFDPKASRCKINEIQKAINIFGSNTIFLVNPKCLEKIACEELFPEDTKLKSAISKFKLFFPDHIPVYPIQQSQYIVDYANNQLFYFNLYYNGRFTHFVFQIQWGKETLVGEPLEAPFPAQNSPTFFDIGLCSGSNKIFCVYGQSADGASSTDSDRIFYYDQAKKKWFEPKIIAADPLKSRIARHGVTCCFFEDSGRSILYVFGGDSNQFEIAGRTMIWNIVEFYDIDFKKNIMTHHVIDKGNYSYPNIAFLPYFHSHAIQTGNKIMIFGGKHFNRSVYETEHDKVFCYSVTEQKFLPIKVNVETFDLDKRPQRAARTSKPIIGLSPNGLWTQKNYFLLIQTSASEVMIARVSPQNMNPTNSIFEDLDKSPPKAHLGLFTYITEGRNLPFQVPMALQWQDQGKIVRNNKLVFKIINCLRKEDSTTFILFSLLISCLVMIEKEKKSLNQSEFQRYLVKLLEDPLFKNKLHKEIGAAAVEMCSIFGRVAMQDFAINQQIREITNELNYNPRERDQAVRAEDAELVKLVLSNKIGEKEVLVSSLLIELQHFIDDLNIWKIDRIFQRNSLLRQYHRPIFDEVTQRWAGQDLTQLISMELGSFREYAQEEDTGILRDLTITLAKLLNFLKNHAFSSKMSTIDTQLDWVSIERIETEECRFWSNDTGRDELMKSKHITRPTTQHPVLNSDLFAPKSQKQVSEKLVNLLAELAVRERLDVSLINLKRLDDFMPANEEKWVNLKYSLPEIWAMVASLLGHTFDPNSLSSLNKQSTKKSQDSFLESVSPFSVTKPLGTVGSYHSLQNLLSAHNSRQGLEGAHFFISPPGSKICCLREKKMLSMKLTIYNANNNTLYPFYLEDNQLSSLCLWNSAAYLHCDVRLAKRFLPQDLWKTFSNCLLYSDMREAFRTDGRFSRMLVFAPVLKEEDELLSRAAIADERGIYVIGGYLPRRSKRHPLIPSVLCSFYELNRLTEIGSNIVEGHLDSMEINNGELAVAQTRNNIFVASQPLMNSGFLTLEIFEKEDFSWLPCLRVPIEQSYSRCYLKIWQGPNQQEFLLIILRRVGKKSTAMMISIDEIISKCANGEQAVGFQKVERNDSMMSEEEEVAVNAHSKEFQLLSNYYYEKVSTEISQQL